MSVVLRAVQESVAKRILPPVICVFCNPGAGTFRDNRVPGVLGETMFITEFVPMIDAKFRTVASRDGRALLGFSMGGSGTLRFVLGHPDVFESGVSLGSPRLRDEEPAMSRLDQVKQTGSAVMIVMGSKEAATSRELAPPFVRGLAAQGVSVSLITPEGVPHNLDLYLTASWAEVAAFFGGHLRGPVAP